MKFKPPFHLKNSHFQTIFPLLLKPKKIEYFQEEFILRDGDFVDLSWSKEPKDTDIKDLFLLFHGLGGSVHSHYIQGMMKRLDLIGHISVVMHFRGCSGRGNNSIRSYHSGEIEDPKEVIKHLKQRFPNTKLHVVSYSLGANMTLKLLASYKNNSPITSAVAVNPPFELEKCTKHLSVGFRKIYQTYLLTELKKQLIRKSKIYSLEKYNLDEKKISKIKSIYEFDDLYTAPVHGFKNAHDYYTKCSSRQFLKDIDTPTLLIHSLDDPFMPLDIYPKKEELSEFITYELGHFGGHVGFVEGSVFKPRFWLEDRIEKAYSSSFGGF